MAIVLDIRDVGDVTDLYKERERDDKKKKETGSTGN